MVLTNSTGKRHWGRSAAASLLAMVALTGCGGTDGGDATAVKEVNVYSSRHYDSDRVLYENFQQETGIKVNLIEGKDDELIERIASEGDNSPADVLIAVDAGRLWRAEEAGIAAEVASPALEAAIPEQFRDAQGRWFGLSQRVRSIVYNKDKVQPSELSTYEDLGDPKWKGRVCVRSSNNIYNQSLVAGKIESLGLPATETWVKSLVANFAQPPDGNDTSQMRFVAQGKCDVALVNHYYVARLMKSDDPAAQEVTQQIGVFFPRPAHVNISGASAIATAPNPENAQQFLEYLITPEAQAVFAQGNNEYPLVTGIEVTDETLKSFGSFEPEPVDVAAYGRNNAEAVKVMDRAGWR